MKLPVIKAFGETFAVVFGNFLDVIKIVFVPLLVLAGLSYWLLPHMFDQLTSLMDTMENMDKAHPDVTALMAAMQPISSSAGIILLAEIVVIPMMVAGLLRLAINNEKPGFIYLSWGGNEFRVLITFILKYLLLCAIYIGGAIAIALAAGLSIAAAGKAGPIVVAVAVFAFIVLMCWIMLRLSLSSAAAVGSGKIGIGPSWSATKGAVWSLLLYWILWFVLLIIVECVFTALFMPGLMQNFTAMSQGAMIHANDHVAAQRAVLQAEKEMFQAMARQLPLLIGFGAVLSLVVYPLLICSTGVAWRLLNEGGEARSEA
jgi:hypothetical protein